MPKLVLTLSINFTPMIFISFLEKTKTHIMYDAHAFDFKISHPILFQDDHNLIFTHLLYFQ